MSRVTLVASTKNRRAVLRWGRSLSQAGHQIGISLYDQADVRLSALKDSHGLVILLDEQAVSSPYVRQIIRLARARFIPVILLHLVPLSVRVKDADHIDASVNPQAALEELLVVLSRPRKNAPAKRSLSRSHVLTAAIATGILLFMLVMPFVKQDDGLSGQSLVANLPTLLPTLDPDTIARASAGQASVTATDSEGTPLSTLQSAVDLAGEQPAFPFEATPADSEGLPSVGPIATRQTPTSAVTVSDGLLASMSANVQSGRAPLFVRFTNNSIGDISDYAWDFDGDGTIDSTERDPLPYTYATSGTYLVRLSVTGAAGQVSEDTMVIEVSSATTTGNDNTGDTGPAFASISAQPMSGSAPLTVNFENDSLGAITAYAWDFNDDGVIDSTAENPPPYTYSTPGTYTVTLDVTGAEGEGFPDSVLIVVYGQNDTGDDDDDDDNGNNNNNNNGNNNGAYASFFVSPTFGTAPLTVRFFNDTLGTVAGYAWDFNDDGVTDSTAENPSSYTYQSPGSYTVSLAATGADGYTDTFTASVIVYAPDTGDPLEARFTAAPTQGPAPLVVRFTDQSSGTITSYAWDFNGDGTTDSSSQNPTHTFTTAGTFTVSLVVSGSSGSSEAYTVPITVVNPPTSTPSRTPTQTPTASATATGTVTATRTATPTASTTASATPTATASMTATATMTPTPTLTVTATFTPTPTSSPTATATPSSTPSLTLTPSPSATPSSTATATAPATQTPQP